MSTTTRESELAASKAAVMSAFDKLMEAKEHFKLAADAAGLEIKDETIEQLLKGRAKTEELAEQATVFIREKPLATLSIAFLTGFLLSQIFSRK